MIRRLTFTGSTLRPRSLALKAKIVDAVLREIWPLVESGAIRPRIDTVLPLKDTRAAHERMESSAHRGKIMLEVAGG